MRSANLGFPGSSPRQWEDVSSGDFSQMQPYRRSGILPTTAVQDPRQPVIGPPGGLSPGPAAVSPTKRSDFVKPFGAACPILATTPPSIPSTLQTKPRRFCQLQLLRVSNHFSRLNRHPRLCVEIRKVAILASGTISLRCHASMIVDRFYRLLSL